MQIFIGKCMMEKDLEKLKELRGRNVKEVVAKALDQHVAGFAEPEKQRTIDETDNAIQLQTVSVDEEKCTVSLPPAASPNKEGCVPSSISFSSLTTSVSSESTFFTPFFSDPFSSTQAKFTQLQVHSLCNPPWGTEFILLLHPMFFFLRRFMDLLSIQGEIAICTGLFIGSWIFLAQDTDSAFPKIE